MAINPGQGTVFKFNSVAVIQVIEVDGPETSVEAKEITNLADTVKKFRTLVPDGGTCSIKAQYDPSSSTQTALTTAINTYPQTAVSCSVQFNDAGTGSATFSAFITRFKSVGMTQEDNLECECDFKINGLVTWPST